MCEKVAIQAPPSRTKLLPEPARLGLAGFFAPAPRGSRSLKSPRISAKVASSKFMSFAHICHYRTVANAVRCTAKAQPGQRSTNHGHDENCRRSSEGDPEAQGAPNVARQS